MLTLSRPTAGEIIGEPPENYGRARVPAKRERVAELLERAGLRPKASLGKFYRGAGTNTSVRN
ncbi:MAG: hypothetical protein ACREH6_01615 [Geminicoccaceae bacterium]